MANQYSIIYKLKSEPFHLLHGSMIADSIEEVVNLYGKYMKPIEFVSITKDGTVRAIVDFAG